LIRLLSRLVGSGQANTKRTFQFKKPSFKELPSAQTGPVLPERVPASVTEHTTRTFAAAYREPRA
ncbi:MAG: hypothetical protein ACRD9R_09835, partial [Pyrinomonadaceae bacterium]